MTASRPPMNFRALPALVALLVAPWPLAGCAQDEDLAHLSPAARRGKQVYLNCVACHGPDPTQDGPQGPAIAGASRALIEARVVRGEYPEGYEPKRGSRIMQPMKHLAPHIDELAAYLEEVARPRPDEQR